MDCINLLNYSDVLGPFSKFPPEKKTKTFSIWTSRINLSQLQIFWTLHFKNYVFWNKRRWGILNFKTVQRWYARVKYFSHSLNKIFFIFVLPIECIHYTVPFATVTLLKCMLWSTLIKEKSIEKLFYWFEFF